MVFFVVVDITPVIPPRICVEHMKIFELHNIQSFTINLTKVESTSILSLSLHMQTPKRPDDLKYFVYFIS